MTYARSSVTAQMQSLEEAVVTALSDRSGRQTGLTEAGLLLLPHAERVIDITETARREVAAVSPPGRWLTAGGVTGRGGVRAGPGFCDDGQCVKARERIGRSCGARCDGSAARRLRRRRTAVSGGPRGKPAEARHSPAWGAGR
ncbi:hypothetical protein AB0E62_20925 [Streptomyces sp. NPDC038707]|uniref:hypothetical protein n=1 Tax=Streptomyces sp. NPDC038707 TaxID=3154329 RepID=UPI003406EFA9